MNLTTCIQTINFTGNGRITDVTFNQEQHCGQINQKDTCDPPCVAPEVCMAGICRDSEKCIQDNDCGPNGTMSCEDGVCVDKPKKYLPIIIGVFVGLLALIGGGFFVWKWWKNRPKTATSTATQ
jgi:hypothetical protein